VPVKLANFSEMLSKNNDECVKEILDRSGT